MQCAFDGQNQQVRNQDVHEAPSTLPVVGGRVVDLVVRVVVGGNVFVGPGANGRMPLLNLGTLRENHRRCLGQDLTSRLIRRENKEIWKIMTLS